MDRVYLDSNATTRVAQEVLDAMLPWFRERWGNPSSLHPPGEEAADALRVARGEVARLVGGAAGEIVFNSGASESIATAFESARRRGGERTRFVTSTVEHSAAAAQLERCAELGLETLRVGVDEEGRLDREALFAAIDERTALVSLLVANNETGVLTDLTGVGAACRAAGAWLHLDAVQAPGKVPLDVGALAADLLSLSAHKFHGPKGVGVLWARRDVPTAALVLGGPQEHDARAGTENVPGIVGTGVAASLAREHAADPGARAALAALRDRLEAGILARVPGARVQGAGAPRVPNTSCIGFATDGEEELEATTLLALLGAAGVDVSAGSACHADRSAPSPVLLAMGRDETEAAGSLRFSLSRETSGADIERAIDAVVEAVETLRALAPAARPQSG